MNCGLAFEPMLLLLIEFTSHQTCCVLVNLFGFSGRPDQIGDQTKTFEFHDETLFVFALLYSKATRTLSHVRF